MIQISRVPGNAETQYRNIEDMVHAEAFGVDAVKIVAFDLAFLRGSFELFRTKPGASGQAFFLKIASR